MKWVWLSQLFALIKRMITFIKFIKCVTFFTYIIPFNIHKLSEK